MGHGGRKLNWEYNSFPEDLCHERRRQETELRIQCFHWNEYATSDGGRKGIRVSMRECMPRATEAENCTDHAGFRCYINASLCSRDILVRFCQ